MDLSRPVTAVVPSLEGEVLSVLSRSRRPLSGSRVAVLASTGSNPGVRLALARLVEQGVVTVERSGPSLLYLANREHLMWPAVQQLVDAAATVLDRLGDRVVEVCERPLDGGTDAVSVSIFGSVARGDSTADSDVDIVLVHTSDAAPADLADAVATEVERATGNAANVLEVSRADLRRMASADDPLLASLEREVRTLHGPDLRRLIEEARCPEPAR